MLNKIVPYPAGLERRYFFVLNGMMGRLKDVTDRIVKPAFSLAVVEKNGVRLDDWNDTLQGAVAQLRLSDTDPVFAGMREVQNGVLLHQQKNWNALGAQMVGVRALQADPGMAALMNGWADQNSELIGSISDQYRRNVSRIVSEGVMNGAGSKAVAAELEKTYNLSRARARLIARTETAKLNGQISQQRQTSLGIEEYTWQTARDERVRPSHRALQGKICRWDDPSVYRDPGNGTEWHPRSNIGGYVGTPGSDFQCRCVSGARVQSLLDKLPAFTGRPTPGSPRAVRMIGEPVPVPKVTKPRVPRPPKAETTLSTPLPEVVVKAPVPASPAFDKATAQGVDVLADGKYAIPVSPAPQVRGGGWLEVPNAFENEAGNPDWFMPTDLDPKLAEKRLRAALKYDSMDYVKINGGLRKGELPAKYKQFVKDWDATFQPISRDTITYRGLKSGEMLKNAAVGDVIVDDAYVSTSLNPQIALAFGRGETILQVSIPKGSPVIVYNEMQSEFVLPRGSRLKVVEIIDNVEVTGKADMLNIDIPKVNRIVRVEVVPSDAAPLPTFVAPAPKKARGDDASRSTEERLGGVFGSYIIKHEE